MERKNIITISDDGVVYIPTNAKMQEYEIAELFGVRYSQVRKAIAIIFKSGALNEHSDMQYSVLDNGNRADLYNIDMVTAIAFLLHTPSTQAYRKWIISKATQKVATLPPIFINIERGAIC